jgi:exodeoxyribonuclease VII small subunit
MAPSEPSTAAGGNRPDRPPAELTFEQAMARLETIVARLESGELTLDESLSLFEEGIGLARVCTLKLEEAEARTELLVEESGGKISLKAFRQEGKGQG